ncbi:MAG: hypothetical protein A3F13_05375 [Gammaproteobacteria bacterium RIFCSPHIGHO2_12_FULL_40_19]|nr:MAG: hypothetical protein A3F13_05375 [Gammaproteobacteria bacterium RIFCSPHIGHO2_12_FULL_40_19]
MKAIILAAGRGERMRPLTLKTPKPLLSVGNMTLIDHALYQLRIAGITDVVINVHHLGEQIMQHCGDGSAIGMCIQYSIENELLETGGGIYQALPLLGDKPFLVVSADVWTAYPLKQLTQKNVSGAHLVFVDNPDFHPKGDYGLDSKGIVHFDTSIKYTYANIAVLHPDLFRDEKAGVFRLSTVFHRAIKKGVMTGEHYTGVWHNVGTPNDLERLGPAHKYPLGLNGTTFPD